MNSNTPNTVDPATVVYIGCINNFNNLTAKVIEVVADTMYVLKAPTRLFNNSYVQARIGWGAKGMEATQTAIALILDATGDEAKAQQYGALFGSWLVAKLPADQEWTLTRAEVLSKLNEAIAWSEKKRGAR